MDLQVGQKVKFVNPRSQRVMGGEVDRLFDGGFYARVPGAKRCVKAEISDLIPNNPNAEIEAAEVIYEPVPVVQPGASEDAGGAALPAAPPAPPVAIQPAGPRVLQIQEMSPVQQISAWQEIARPLADIIKQRNLYKRIKDKDYVLIEGWNIMMAMLGVQPIVVWTRPVSEPPGWEARVEWRTAKGEVAAAGEAQCTRSEKMWERRDDFALRSMAQTRAAGKAARLGFSFIIELAGYAPTPEEEMPGGGQGGPSGSRGPDASAPPSPAPKISVTKPHMKSDAELQAETRPKQAKTLEEALQQLKALFEKAHIAWTTPKEPPLSGLPSVPDKSRAWVYLDDSMMQICGLPALENPDKVLRWVDLGYHPSWVGEQGKWVEGELSLTAMNNLIKFLGAPTPF